MNELRTWLYGALLVAATALLIGAASPEIPGEILRFEAMRSLGDGRLAALLDSTDPQIAARAALAIGRTKQPAGAPLLAAHLHDPRASVRALSVYGLGLIGLGTEATAIIDAAATDRAGAVRIAALDAVGRYEEGKRLRRADEVLAVGTLDRVLASDPDPLVRGRAAIALSFFAKSPAAWQAAAALAAATSPRESGVVRERAMWTIFRDYAREVPLNLLRDRLADPDETVRIEAARAFGQLHGAALASDLRPLLRDRSWRVQEQAAESIRVLEGGAMTQHWERIPAGIHTPAPVPDPLEAYWDS